VSVATIETSAKHRLPGVNQTYLSGGMSIHEGLQAALKQDPNIIMIDNVPDGPTAEQAVHAATTGHLVLAGLHAESSIAALLRLRHTGVEPFLLMTSLRASVGQRLVRKLCPECRERYALSDEERGQLEESFGIATPAARKRVHELEKSAAPSIFGDVKQLNSTPAQITHLWKPSETGCDTCEHTGYKGRTAITEVLKNTDGLQKALLAREIMSTGSVQALMLKDGFIPMGLDGLVKALRGQTTATEVLKAMAGQT
ncbi:MAG TPA: ATPase, T2SS/T4P/T4SS family, partial [Candidatus Saccharimonadales bacterium]